jgi:hypothetical protein
MLFRRSIDQYAQSYPNISIPCHINRLREASACPSQKSNLASAHCPARFIALKWQPYGHAALLAAAIHFRGLSYLAYSKALTSCIYLKAKAARQPPEPLAAGPLPSPKCIAFGLPIPLKEELQAELNAARAAAA